MTKKKSTKTEKNEQEIELEGLIEKNENMANVMKKIISSIENKKSK